MRLMPRSVGKNWKLGPSMKSYQNDVQRQPEQVSSNPYERTPASDSLRAAPPRRVNDHEQRGIGTAASNRRFRTERRARRRLVVWQKFPRFGEAVEQQACRIFWSWKRLTVRIAGRAGIDCFRECRVLSRPDDLRPTRGIAARIESRQRNHVVRDQAATSRARPRTANARTASRELVRLQSPAARRLCPNEGPAPRGCHRQRGSKRRASPCACPDVA